MFREFRRTQITVGLVVILFLLLLLFTLLDCVIRVPHEIVFGPHVFSIRPIIVAKMDISSDRVFAVGEVNPAIVDDRGSANIRIVTTLLDDLRFDMRRTERRTES